MTTDLRDALHDLADDGRPGAGPPPDLWTRGVRRARRRRAVGGLVAVVLAVVVGGVGSLTWQRLVERPVPAGQEQRVAIPNRLVTPSRWLPGTDDAGPPGPLAVLVGAERAAGTFSTGSGIVGVSAGTGAYRFLDLPGLARPSDMIGEVTPALSPDGRAVGYWVGETHQVDGIAAYDAVTGKLWRHTFPSDKGLAPSALTWVDDHTLRADFSWITRRTAHSMAAERGGTYLWTPATGRLVRAPAGAEGSWGVHATASGYSLLGRGLSLWSLDGTRRARFTLAGGGDVGDAVVSPAEKRVAALVSRGGDISNLSLRVGELPAGGGRVATRAVPVRLAVSLVAGWVDDRHVVVTATDPHGDGWGMYAVDVRTGAARRLVALDLVNFVTGQQFATDLWAHPTVTRPAPARVVDPRWPGVLLGGAVLVALLVLWRRRARRV